MCVCICFLYIYTFLCINKYIYAWSTIVDLLRPGWLVLSVSIEASSKVDHFMSTQLEPARGESPCWILLCVLVSPLSKGKPIWHVHLCMVLQLVHTYSIYVYIYIHGYICIYIYIYIYNYVCIWTGTYIYIHIYIYKKTIHMLYTTCVLYIDMYTYIYI